MHGRDPKVLIAHRSCKTLSAWRNEEFTSNLPGHILDTSRLATMLQLRVPIQKWVEIWELYKVLFITDWWRDGSRHRRLDVGWQELHIISSGHWPDDCLGMDAGSGRSNGSPAVNMGSHSNLHCESVGYVHSKRECWLVGFVDLCG